MVKRFARRKKTAAERRLEALSAYLDGALSARERARLENELKRDAALRAELDELSRTVQLTRSLPALPVPRSFVLDPAVFGRARRHRFHLYPALRAATVLATLLFIFLFVGDLSLGSFWGAQAPTDVVAVQPQAVEVVVEKEAERELAAVEAPAVLAEAPVEEEETEAEAEGQVLTVPAEAVVEKAAELEAPPGEAPADAAEVGRAVPETEIMPEAEVEADVETAGEPVEPTATLAAAAVAAAPEPTPAPTQPEELGASAGGRAPTVELMAMPTASAFAVAEEGPSEPPTPGTSPSAPEPVMEEVQPETGEAESIIEAEEEPTSENAVFEAVELPAVVPEEPEPVPWWWVARAGAGVLAVGLLVGTLLARRLGW